MPMDCSIKTRVVDQSELGRLDPATGKVDIISISMTSGINLRFMQGKIHRPFRLDYSPPFESVGFGFYLSGYSETRSDNIGTSVSIKSGESVVNWSNCLSGCSSTIGSGKLQTMGLFMSHKLLSEIADQYKRKLPSLLQKPPDGIAHQKARITPPMRATIQEIAQCPYHGLTRDLFIEGKALELMAFKLDQLDDTGNSPEAATIKKCDIDRVHHAAELLKKDPEHAPGLEQLARSVGMCRTKFHECFSNVYGTTPFEYLQSYRLETARLKIQEGIMNVTEAALAAGYSSPSYFSSVFKKHFGDSPGKFCRNHSFDKNERSGNKNGRY